MEYKVCFAVHRGRTFVDQDQVFAAEIADEAGRRINDEAGAADDEHVGFHDGSGRTVHHVLVEHFFIKDHVGLDDAAAAVAFRDALRVQDRGLVEELVALRAVVAEHRAVQFEDVLAAGLLVQAVDVLRDHGRELASLLQGRQGLVAVVRLRVGVDQLLAVEIEEVFGIAHEEAVRDHFLGGKGASVFLVVEAVRGAEIRDPRSGGYSRAAEEDDAVGIAKHGDELFEVGHGFSFLNTAGRHNAALCLLSYRLQFPTVLGKGMASRMLPMPVRYMTQRSKPRPKPAWRAVPYFRRSR